MNFDSTRVKIDLDAISDNFTAIRKKTGVPVMAVVKADAYGHGAIQVARLLENKCAFFGVSSMLEALELRQAGLKTPILILGQTPVQAFPTAIREGIRPTIFHYEDALALSEEAEKTADNVMASADAVGNLMGTVASMMEDEINRKLESGKIDEKQAKEMHAKTFINDFQKKMRERLLKRHSDND